MKDEEIKLNIGSGKTHLINGYTNVDFMDDPKIDVKHDLRKPLPFKDNSVTHIYASHIIEHFWWKDTEKVLTDWLRVLKKGGGIDIWTVDFDKLIYAYFNHEPDRFEDVMKGINWRLFSKQEPKGNEHHSIFNKRFLAHMLNKVGFSQVVVLDENDYPFRPMHDGINMGVRAIK